MYSISRMFNIFIVNQQEMWKGVVNFLSFNCEVQVSVCSRERLIKSPVLSLCGQNDYLKCWIL